MAEQHHPTNTQNQHPTSKILVVLTLFPIGGICFLLSALILTGTIIFVTIATPLLFIFSPILVPGFLIIALAVTGFLTAEAFGITGFSSMAYIVNYFRRMKSNGGGPVQVQDQLDYAKRYVGQKAQDTARA